MACGQVEVLDEPRASVHVIKADAAEFENHPPASGPHLAVVPEPGVRDEPLPEAEQVAALEGGTVIVHYASRVDSDEVAELKAVAQGRDDVIVTPAATEIDGDQPVALTAWRHRQRCDGVDVEAVERFIEEFAGREIASEELE